jgi:D-glycero-D-manno-heptose 1,7-bisphosphate phosphatase
MMGDVRLYIFDADGTLRRTCIPGQPCPRAPSEWELIPGVAERLRAVRWGPGGTFVGVASNQDQVGYGHLSEEMAHRLLMAMIERATGYRPPAAAIALCPHRLDVPCECRKPGTAMLTHILKFYRVAPSQTVFVGDAPADAEAARRAGVRFVWAHDYFDREN